MKYIKSIFEYSEDEEKIPWAEPNRLGLSYARDLTKDNLPKPGDKVRCKPGFRGGSGGDSMDPSYAGAGYIENSIFTVKNSDPCGGGRAVVWFSDTRCGVYFDALEYVY